MRKVIAVCAATLAVALVAGFGARQAGVGQESEPCMKPLTLLQSEQTASIDALEAYIASEIAPLYKNPDQLIWLSDDYNPLLTPTKIAAGILVVETGTGESRSYEVALVRACAGDEWEVVKFKRVGKLEPLAQKPA